MSGGVDDAGAEAEKVGQHCQAEQPGAGGSCRLAGLARSAIGTLWLPAALAQAASQGCVSLQVPDFPPRRSSLTSTAPSITATSPALVTGCELPFVRLQLTSLSLMGPLKLQLVPPCCRSTPRQARYAVE